MIKVSLCPVLYSQNDVMIAINPDSDFNYQSRRITRTATLDGGCYIADNGFTSSDGTIKLVVSYDNYLPSLSSIIEQFGLVTVSSTQGFFECALESITPGSDVVNVNLLIKSKL